MKYAGSDWIRSTLKKDISPLGANVADLLGDVFRGIYHLDRSASLARADWADDYVIVVVVSNRSLPTVDGDELTRLVVGAHDRMLRMDVRAVAPNRLQLMFHQRTRDGDLSHRCPTMEGHVEQLRQRAVKEAIWTSATAE